MTTPTSHKPKNSHKSLQKKCLRDMTVKQLRECFAGISPCPHTFAHIQIERKARMRQILDFLPPSLTEAPDGTLEPAGYAAETATLLQALDPADSIATIIRPKASGPAASPLPLLTAINRRITTEHIKTNTIALFTHWEANGIKNPSQQNIARELSLSASTYNRNVKLTYPLQDTPSSQNNVSITAPEVSTHEDQVSLTLPDAVIHAETAPTNTAEAITPDDAVSTIKPNANTQSDHMPAASMEFDLFSTTHKD